MSRPLLELGPGLHVDADAVLAVSVVVIGTGTVWRYSPALVFAGVAPVAIEPQGTDDVATARNAADRLARTINEARR